MSTSGIRTKKVLKGSRQFDEHARRYVWYPLSNIDLAGSQATSPCWANKIFKGRIMLLESLEYMVRGDDPEQEVARVRAGETPLVSKTMGTDSQVQFLMGNTDGSGWMERGMTHLESILDVDPQTVADIEELILADENGDIVVPNDLVEFETLLRAKSFVGDNPISEKAEAVRVEMLKGIQSAKMYCERQSAALEKELREGQSGRMGIRSIDPVGQYYFKQIRKPLPDDRAGVNAGNEMATALAPLLKLVGANNAPAVGNSFEKELELEELKSRVASQESIIAEQTETIKTLSETE